MLCDRYKVRVLGVSDGVCGVGGVRDVVRVVLYVRCVCGDVAVRCVWGYGLGFCVGYGRYP